MAIVDGLVSVTQQAWRPGGRTLFGNEPPELN
jgi:hypothetical protein